MIQVLRNISSGKPADDGFPQGNQRGGFPAVMTSLRKRGLIDGRDRLTYNGEAALHEHITTREN